MSVTNPFVAQFPISTDDIYHTLTPHIGQTINSLFQQPDSQTKNLVQTFLQTMQNYENNPSTDLFNKLNSLINQLDLGVIRPQEEPDDVLIFYPKQHGHGQPFKVGATLVWRMGAIKVNSDPTTYNNPVNNFCHICEHEGQDGTTYLAIDIFMAGKGKFWLLNASAPHVAENPNKHATIKAFSDPAHSNTTIFVPILQQLLQKMYPDMPMIITHGMDGGAHFKLLLNNNYNGQFFKNGKRSFANMLAIALAQQNFGTIPVVSVASIIPGYIVKNGVTMPMSPTKQKQGALRHPGSAINTNVDGHIADFSQAPLFSLGKQTDRAIHVEADPDMRAKVSQKRDKYMLALQNAIRWYREYDPAIHDPWQLETRFPDVYKDMSKYDTLFDPAFVANYKKQHATTYLADTNKYATAASVTAAADNANANANANPQAMLFAFGNQTPMNPIFIPNLDSMEISSGLNAPAPGF